MKKYQKVETIERMLNELGNEHNVGGFNEYDQEITNLFGEILPYLSHEGLNFAMNYIEETSKVGVNRRKPMTIEDMKQWATDNNRRRGLNA
ncbi:hypothetical protein [Bacillus thuringiensis]|uniref:hypothetical protein n=1 Tax=Bacillus thuringiensis TaxID=1428 RepID=UPI000BF927B0|nr:hypothetical protein [Bacillus thuringiensis]PEV64187.1 hypothetical protein CN434_25600 [Bacillus thuringiensis]